MSQSALADLILRSSLAIQQGIFVRKDYGGYHAYQCDKQKNIFLYHNTGLGRVMIPIWDYDESPGYKNLTQGAQYRFRVLRRSVIEEIFKERKLRKKNKTSVAVSSVAKVSAWQKEAETYRGALSNKMQELEEKLSTSQQSSESKSSMRSLQSSIDSSASALNEKLQIALKRLNSISAELNALKDRIETVGKADSVGDNGEGEVRDSLESRNFAIMKTVIDVAHHNCQRPHEMFVSLESLYRMFGKPKLTAKDNLLLSTVDELARSSFTHRDLRRRYNQLREDYSKFFSDNGNL